ncbi:hypothetical protein B0T19DRAFT_293532 [Cercophora scortea]|uniref:Uncharacterized protein n=1 Tax=Cercophora scortea TaxID=314031 RepID=A0AAE0I2W1_9PEZI|nr:hypothetical protein B0T19DRAFT_293532 [Cercophora scortea]
MDLGVGASFQFISCRHPAYVDPSPHQQAVISRLSVVWELLNSAWYPSSPHHIPHLHALSHERARFRGVVGYHVCLTRKRSPVQAWTESTVLFALFAPLTAILFLFITVQSDTQLVSPHLRPCFDHSLFLNDLNLPVVELPELFVTVASVPDDGAQSCPSSQRHFNKLRKAIFSSSSSPMNAVSKSFKYLDAGCPGSTDSP